MLVKAVINSGRVGRGPHCAYLPDVETMIRLVDRAGELPAFARFHTDGFRDADGRQMLAVIAGAEPKVNSSLMDAAAGGPFRAAHTRVQGNALL